VSEYLLERMILAGAGKICFIISPGKSDILEYFGDSYSGASIVYLVQPKATGLCDAIFRAHCVIADNESVVVGLPDTVWFPTAALADLPDDILSFLLFPVDRPEFFDAVLLDAQNHVREIRVKQENAGSNWIWGAFKMPGSILHELFSVWKARRQQDEYVGTLVNAWLPSGGRATAVPAGESYVDVGTVRGYREAVSLLSQERFANEAHL
jgi:dTDP-glucose pyrophosphorylase